MHIPSLRLQAILDAIVPVGLYGPLSSRWDAERQAIVARPNWSANRLPAADVLSGRGHPDTWGPHVPVACSTLVGLVLGVYLGAGPDYDPAWGASITAAVKTPFLASHMSWVGGGKRIYRCDAPPQDLHLPPLWVAIQSGHTWLVLDCNQLDICHPITGETLSHLWAFAADGSYDDVQALRCRAWGRWRKMWSDTKALARLAAAAGTRRGIVRSYNCRSVRFEPLSVRAERLRMQGGEAALKRAAWRCLAVHLPAGIGDRVALDITKGDRTC
jgi:hypothetical protein